jgi:hypothetical protein
MVTAGRQGGRSRLKTSTLLIAAAGAAVLAYGAYIVLGKASILPRLKQPSQETTLPAAVTVVPKTTSADNPVIQGSVYTVAIPGMEAIGAADLLSNPNAASNDLYVQPDGNAVSVSNAKPAKGGVYLE